MVNDHSGVTGGCRNEEYELDEIYYYVSEVRNGSRRVPFMVAWKCLSREELHSQSDGSLRWFYTFVEAAPFDLAIAKSEPKRMALVPGLGARLHSWNDAIVLADNLTQRRSNQLKDWTGSILVTPAGPCVVSDQLDAVRQINELETRGQQFTIHFTNNPSDELLSTIGESKNLRDVMVSPNCDFDAFIDEMALWTNTRSLSLTGLELSRHVFEVLGRMTWLRSLVLDDTTFDESNFVALQSLRHVIRLSLKRTAVGDSVCHVIGQMESLHYLFLDDTRISDIGVKHLSPLATIETLSIPGTQIDGTSFADLKMSRELQCLAISRTRISDGGLRNIEELSELRLLVIGGNNISYRAIRCIQEALLKCSIIVDELRPRELDNFSPPGS
jgi:hypothetical protein